MDVAIFRLPNGTYLELMQYLAPDPGSSTWRPTPSATATSAS